MAPALKKESHDFRTRVIKFQHDWLNVGVQCHHIHGGTPNECPVCRQPGEHGIHLLCCPAEEMRESGKLAIREFKKFMSPVKTAPVILHMIVRAIEATMRGETVPHFAYPMDCTGEHLRRAVQEQSDIGWENLVKGRVSRHWAKAQESFTAGSGG